MSTVGPLTPTELAEELRRKVLVLLPNGHEFPLPADDLASELGISTRLLRGAIEDLVRIDGYLIGSSCEAGRAGYFLAVTPEDVEVGTRHLRSRALSLLDRVSALRRNAAVMFDGNPEVLRLFDLDVTEEATP